MLLLVIVEDVSQELNDDKARRIVLLCLKQGFLSHASAMLFSCRSALIFISAITDWWSFVQCRGTPTDSKASIQYV